MPKDIHTEEYVCEECGNVTAVPNDFCPSCNAPMSPLHSEPKPKIDEDDDDFSKLHDGIGEESEEESLEKLRAEEEDEAEADYHKSFNDPDNAE